MTFVGITDVSTLLLIEVARLASADRVLVLSAGDPALVLAAARQAALVDVYDASYTALRRVRQQAQAQRVGNVTVHESVYPPPVASYDAALLSLPKGRDLARAQMWAALQALRPGGRLYFAGPNAGGAKTLIDDAAQLFGRCATLLIKRRHRAGVATRPDAPPYLPPGWGADPTIVQRRTFETPGGPLNVATMPGIFSWEHLDDGTRFLLENLQIEAGQTILDVGCGNGIIGLCAAPRAHQMVMVDDNLLAVRCAQETLAMHGLANATAQPGDVYEDFNGQTFDLILSNPPFHRHFDVDTNVAHRIMRGAGAMLNAGGRLVIVANAFLKYEQVMRAHLKRSRALARNHRFVVLEGRI